MKNTMEEKSTEWQQHFINCQNSGLSQTQYCQKHNITEAKFYYWKKQLGLVKKKTSLEPNHKTPKFVSAQVLPQPHHGFTIRLNNGISIEGLPIQDETILPMIKVLNSL
ncbi:MAG: hypothetical protein OEX07_17060 [Gammaproteobacteria bacterium]|nr:hypothetical protein [Gammaproteobacteria bacterium]